MILVLVGLFAADRYITGAVKDQTGRPATGVEVALVSWSFKESPTAKTNAEGRYSILAPSQYVAGAGVAAVVAFDPIKGFVVKSMALGDDNEFTLHFKRPTGTRVPILDATGKPLVGASVFVTGISQGGEHGTPPSFAKHVRKQTDANGVVEFKLLDRDQIARIDVETEAGMRQSFRAAAGLRGWDGVQLAATKVVHGRLTGSPLPKDAEIVIESNSPRNRTGMRLIRMESRVRVGDDGRFSAAVLTEGHWGPKIEREEIYLVEEQREIPSNDAETTWTLKPTTPVVGVVRTADGAPVPNALVMFYTPTTQPARLIADDNGRYSGRIPAGKRSRTLMTSQEFEIDRNASRTVVVPESATPVELPPFVVERAETVSGWVVDADGNPSAAVRVVASCRVAFGGGGWSTTYRSGYADQSGAFRLTGVPRGSVIDLRAFDKKSGEYSDGVVARPGDTNAKLTLRPNSSHSVEVAVLDDSGRPVAPVELNVEVRPETSDYGGWLERLRPEFQQPVHWSEARPTPLGAFSKGHSVQISARADGFLLKSSSWVSINDVRQPIVIKLQRESDVAGRVTDSSGKPIAAVLVAPAGCYGLDVETTTDADGRFQLKALPHETMVVTANKPGWRRGGGVAKAGTETSITMKRPDDPAPRAMATEFANSAAMSELAKRLVEPLAEQVFTNKGGSKEWWAQSYAFMNPSKLLEFMEGPNWTAEERDYVRSQVSVALTPTDFDEAMSQAQAVADTERKAGTLLGIAKALAGPNDKRRAVLADALVAARAGNDPAHRIINIVTIGEALHTLGDPNGEKAIREAQSLVATIPAGGLQGYTVGRVAESLALFDFEAAMKMTEELPGNKGEVRSKVGGDDSYLFNRHRGNMAHKIAGLQPANAERAFLSVNDADRRSKTAASVCYRMAPVDLERAKRLAAHARDPGEKAVCFTAMAMALGSNRKAEALPMLKEGYASLAKGDRSGFAGGPLGLGLLHIVAAVAPEEVDDFFWQAMSLPRADRTYARSAYGGLQISSGIGMMSLLTQRFDAPISAALASALRSEVDSLVSQFGSRYTGSDAELSALASLFWNDPTAADAILKIWPPVGKEGKPQDNADRARTAVGALLRANPQKRSERLVDRYLHQWVIDKEDL